MYRHFWNIKAPTSQKVGAIYSFQIVDLLDEKHATTDYVTSEQIFA